jgi:hypothetical protein
MFSTVVTVDELFVVTDDDDIGDVRIGCNDALESGLLVDRRSVCDDCSDSDTWEEVVIGEDARRALFVLR